MKKILVCLTLLFSVQVANATPLTFAFTIPNWDYNANPTLFGSGLSLNFTVDNGGTSGLGQDFDFSEIISVDANAIGGTASTHFDTATDGHFAFDNIAFISTDSAGIPTLHIGRQNESLGAFDIDNLAYHLMLRQFDTTDTWGYAAIAFYTGAGVTAWYNDNVAPLSGDVNEPIDIIGTNTVPEPATIVLMCLGLLGIGFSSTRKAAFW